MSQPNYFLTAMIAVLLTVCANRASADIIIDTVPVGDQGNATDTRYETPGYGGLEYGYNIGKFEVTAGQYTAFLNAVAATDAYGLYNTDMWLSEFGCGIERSGSPGSYTYSVAGDGANRPVNFVSWGDSARFANWMHNGQPAGAQNQFTTEDGSYDLSETQAYYDSDGQILDWNALNLALTSVTRTPNATWAIPSENEWYKAAYYKGGSTNAGYWDYPTSSNMAPGRDMDDVSGNNANYYDGNGPHPIDSPHYTTVVGEFQNSDSPYGTFDQGGNIWEWNEAVVLLNEGDPYAFRGIRAGSFFFDEFSPMRASVRRTFDPSSDDISVGFRVSLVPEPGSLALLTIMAVGVLGWRRTRCKRA